MLIVPEQSINNLQQGTEFSVSMNPAMFDVLANKLYAKPREAVIRELITNAYDSHKAAGCLDTPIQITVPTEGNNRQLIIEDFGVGISHEDMLTMYTTFGASTKSHDNEFTGGFGLGSKTPFAVVNMFIVESTQNNVTNRYILAKNEGLPTITLDATFTDITKKSGFTIRIALPQDNYHNVDRLVLAYLNTFPEINAVIVKDNEQPYQLNEGRTPLWKDYSGISTIQGDSTLLFVSHGLYVKVGLNMFYIHTETMQKALAKEAGIAGTVISERLLPLLMISKQYTEFCDTLISTDDHYTTSIPYAEVIKVFTKLISYSTGYNSAICINMPIGLLSLSPSREHIQETTENYKCVAEALVQAFEASLNSSTPKCRNWKKAVDMVEVDREFAYTTIKQRKHAFDLQEEYNTSVHVVLDPDNTMFSNCRLVKHAMAYATENTSMLQSSLGTVNRLCDSTKVRECNLHFTILLSDGYPLTTGVVWKNYVKELDDDNVIYTLDIRNIPTKTVSVVIRKFIEYITNTLTVLNALVDVDTIPTFTVRRFTALDSELRAARKAELAELRKANVPVVQLTGQTIFKTCIISSIGSPWCMSSKRCGDGFIKNFIIGIRDEINYLFVSQEFVNAFSSSSEKYVKDYLDNISEDAVIHANSGFNCLHRIVAEVTNWKVTNRTVVCIISNKLRKMVTSLEHTGEKIAILTEDMENQIIDRVIQLGTKETSNESNAANILAKLVTQEYLCMMDSKANLRANLQKLVAVGYETEDRMEHNRKRLVYKYDIDHPNRTLRNSTMFMQSRNAYTPGYLASEKLETLADAILAKYSKREDALLPYINNILLPFTLVPGTMSKAPEHVAAGAYYTRRGAVTPKTITRTLWSHMKNYRNHSNNGWTKLIGKFNRYYKRREQSEQRILLQHNV